MPDGVWPTYLTDQSIQSLQIWYLKEVVLAVVLRLGVDQLDIKVGLHSVREGQR